MVATNHFKNRRLAGSQRALIRHCRCPAVVPVVLPTSTYILQGNFDWTRNGVHYIGTLAPTQVFRSELLLWFTWGVLASGQPFMAQLKWPANNANIQGFFWARRVTNEWEIAGIANNIVAVGPYPWTSGTIILVPNLGSVVGEMIINAAHAFEYPPVNS